MRKLIYLEIPTHVTFSYMTPRSTIRALFHIWLFCVANVSTINFNYRTSCFIISRINLQIVPSNCNEHKQVTWGNAPNPWLGEASLASLLAGGRHVARYNFFPTVTVHGRYIPYTQTIRGRLANWILPLNRRFKKQ